MLTSATIFVVCAAIFLIGLFIEYFYNRELHKAMPKWIEIVSGFAVIIGFFSGFIAAICWIWS